MNRKFEFYKEFRKEPAAGKIAAFKLENGLEVVFLKKMTNPIVAVDIWYKVGSRNEKPGKSGFAHLFEHMMFEGSENVGKAEHMKLINDIGGMVNGSTNQDRTNYWEVVPSNQLELALWLEADRMRSLNLSRENFENQRATVKEERRQRIDNQPYMPALYEVKDEVAYSNFAYKHSVIGSMEDLDNASLEDVQNFHETYYKPNNAVLAIVGNFEVKKALELTKKYFENISHGNHIPSVDLVEPPQKEEKREQVYDPFAPFPAVIQAFHVPGRTHSDFYAMELIEKILVDGESSRLYRTLVEENQSALHIIGGNDGKLGPALFFVFAQVHPRHHIDDLKAALKFEFRRLASEGVSEEELKKAKSKVRSEWISRDESTRSIADYLCMYTTVFGNPEFYFKELERFNRISVKDIQDTVKRYFQPKNGVTIDVIPQKKDR